MLLINRSGMLAAGLAAALLSSTPVAISPAMAQLSFGFSVGGRDHPPPPREEVRPPSPHEGWAWRAGHWGYRDGGYVWIGGDWIEPPYATAAWIPGHWIERDGRQIWIEGHWEG